MTRYIHRFIPQAGAERVLPNEPVRPGLLQVAQLERATAEGNLGWADYAADISVAEFNAFSAVYVIDSLIVLYDADDPLNVDGSGDFTPVQECWAGFLDEPRVGADTVRLGASGYGKLADRMVKHWLWADYDTDQYQPTGDGSDFPYDADDQIKIGVLGRGIRASVARKTEFKQPSGRAYLQSDAETGATKLDLGQVEGLKAGMQITIAGNVGGNVIDAAEYAISQGFTVRGHPKYGGSGSCDGKEGNHVVGSHHCRDLTGTGGDALDINWYGGGAEAPKLIELAAELQARFGSAIDELFHPGNDPVDHGDHLHVSFDGAGASSPTVVRTVAADWRETNTTVKITAALGSGRDAGTKVTWNPASEGRWASSAAGYYPNVNLGGVRFDIDLPRGKNHHYDLEVAKAVGPDGAKTVLETFNLNRHRDEVFVSLTGIGDLALFTVKRDATDETKNANHFVARVSHLRTYGPFTTASVYETWKIVRDVGVELGIGVVGVQETVSDGLPFKVMPGRASDALDAQAAVEDMVWLILGGAAGPELKFRKWGDEGNRVWEITDPHALGTLESMPRYDKLHVAYVHDEGFESIVTMTADPNALTGGIKREYPQVIFQGDRPPPLALAQSFGQPIIDVLNTQRFYGEKNLTMVEDTLNPGVAVPPTRVRPGDKARHPAENNVVLRIQGVALNGDGTVTFSYPETVPILERALAKRTLLLNRGVRQTRATLAGLNLRRPIKPENPLGSWKRIDTRGGEHHFDALANWDDVEDDVGGRAIYIREYIVKWRYRDKDTGVIAKDDDGDPIINRSHIKLESLEDNAEQLPSRARLRNIRNPHKWELEFQVDAISMQHKHSGFTAWKHVGRPPLPEIAAPEALVIDVDQHSIQAEWDAPDLVEVEDDLTPVLDRSVARFRVKWFWRTIGSGGEGTQFGHNRTPATHIRRRVKKIRGREFKFEVMAVDNYGKMSAWATSAWGIASAPPAPAQPAIGFDTVDARKGDRIRAVVAFASVSYLDDDVKKYQVQMQTSANMVFNAADHRRRHTVWEPEEDTDDPMTAWFPAIRRRRYCRARVRSADAQNKFSPWSVWSDTVQAGDPDSPPPPTDVTVDSDFGGVRVDWEATVDPDDTESDVTSTKAAHVDLSHYEVEVHRNSSFTNRVARDRHQVITKRRFPRLTEGLAYWARVRSVSSSNTKSGWVTSTGHTSAPMVDSPQLVDDAVLKAHIAAVQVESSEIADDAVGTSEIEDDGTTTGTGTWRSSGGTTRVEITSAKTNALDMYQAGQAQPGGLSTSNDQFTARPPGAGNKTYISMEDTPEIIKMGADDIQLGVEYTPRGRCGLRIAAGAVTADSIWGQDVTYGGVNKVGTVPSSLTLTAQTGESNVASVSASHFTSRGFSLNVTANVGGAQLLCKREYS